jgi:hypothetical protein
MDCTGDIDRAGNIQQGSGCFFLRDGHDRGMMGMGYIALLTAAPFHLRYLMAWFLSVIAYPQRRRWPYWLVGAQNDQPTDNLQTSCGR